MTVVITGATKGIGRAIAEAFVLKGADIIVCSRNYGDLKAFKADMHQLNPDSRVYIKKADISKKKDITAFGQFIKKNCTTFDILINNAGLFIQSDMLEEEEGVLERMMETNVYSAFYLTRQLLPLLEKNKKGHIFNMCSIASQQAFPNCGSYCMSKFALLGFSKVLREQLKEKQIKVTALLPGPTWSNAWEGVDLPKDRLMQAKDIAKTIIGILELGDGAVVEEVTIMPQLGAL